VTGASKYVQSLLYNSRPSHSYRRYITCAVGTFSWELEREDNLKDLDVDGKGNIEIYLKEIGWESVEYINLLQPSGNFTYHQV
jgi:hypothetical protein